MWLRIWAKVFGRFGFPGQAATWFPIVVTVAVILSRTITTSLYAWPSRGWRGSVDAAVRSEAKERAVVRCMTNERGGSRSLLRTKGAREI